MPRKVFISYRRDDAKWQAREIFRSLTQVLPRDHVFMDIDSIPPGADFVDVLEGWVDRCDILLALIGSGWVDAADPKTGRRRLESSNDFVRIEVRKGLARGIPVVPVLLDGAPIPDVEKLPDDLKRLTRRNAEFIEHRTVDTDVERLIRKLGLAQGGERPGAPSAEPVQSRSPEEQAAQTQTERDATEAARLKLAADRGEAAAQVNLGVFYENGFGGLPKDDREAARLYKLAADQGNAAAQASLGDFYVYGRGGLPEDEREAARLFKLSADQGNVNGQAYLGLFYADGHGGLPKDHREAARLYKLAADQGHAEAQNNLGVIYRDGRGGLPKDDREAARLFKLSADQGNYYAQANLGLFYEYGRGGLPKDHREAARLYTLAADQNVFSKTAKMGLLRLTSGR
jgi:hypothetical protein